MDQKLIKIWDELTPYKSILYFLFLLFFFHFSWKISIGGDRNDDYMLLFGKDITPDWFYTIQLWLTKATAWFIHLFPNTDDLIVDKILLYFSDSEMQLRVAWGCTGVKQMGIFVCIMIFYRCFTLKKKENASGYSAVFLPYWKKLWYIPLGCVILTIYNIIRIGSIVMLVRYHPERFDSLHDGIFRYIYYAIIFLLWVIWEEFFVHKRKTHKI